MISIDRRRINFDGSYSWGDEMEKRELGSTGLQVSVVGFGSGAGGGLMTKGEPADQVRAVVRSLEAGINYFDTAAAYGQGRSEENLGRVLGELKAWDKVVLGTKVRFNDVDRKNPAAWVRESVKGSLTRLKHDRIDLLQLHNPICNGTTGSSPTGDDVPLEEVLAGVAEGMEQVQKEGLVGHLGYTGLGDTEALHTVARDPRFKAVQIYFNALNPSAGYAGAHGTSQDYDGLIDTCAASGVGVLAFRVLANGALIASSDRHPIAGIPNAPLDGGPTYEGHTADAQALLPFVKELGLESGLELGFRFAQSKKGVSSLLIGFSDLSQLEDAIRWSERGGLPAAVVDRIVTLAS
jgi:aryl-alcohol dehydrogenase-like predicted oxidoreductase